MKIYNNFFYDYLDINPELGSFIGNRNYDEYYSISISEEYRNKYYSLCNKYLNKLQKDKNIWVLLIYTFFYFYLNKHLMLIL